MRGNGRIRPIRDWPLDAPAVPIGQSCEWPGCVGDGVYPAPTSRDRLRAYRWLCLDHVRAYNASWNYYAGMTEAEIEADIRHDTVWQRPSWRLGIDGGPAAAGRARLNDAFGFFGEERTALPIAPTVEERALVILDLRPPVTVAIVKARYKQLVKLYHPDANGGDKAAEETFKQISEAYRTVISSLTS